MFNRSHHILYGSERIVFELRPRKSNIQRVLIKVHADCRVVVQAPCSASKIEILNAVKKRARWIYQKHKQFKAQLESITPRHYISGETHYYLGKKYLLKVIKDSTVEPYVKILRGRLEVTVNNKKHTQQLLLSWYKEKAREIFNRRLEFIMPQTLWINESPSIYLRNMQHRWGSCSPTGKLILNPLLVKAPRECIDYVILHELCHIAEHNHSDRFYRLIKQIMPNWEKVKLRLDSMANIFLNSNNQDSSIK